MITIIRLWHDGTPHLVICDAFGKKIADEDISEELYDKLNKYINS